MLDGKDMPIFGLGVFLANAGGDECYNAVKWALELGYRLIDTAEVYQNEAEVGRAIRDSGIPRKEIFVVSKLRDDAHGYEQALRAGRQSAELLAIGYMDLFLVHSPNTGKLIETWDALLKLQHDGLSMSIGVSNFNVAHIEALHNHGRPMPAVNQIEMHPLVYEARRPLLEYCKQHNILVQAYGSIFWGQQDKLNDGTVAQVVAAHPGKTPAQILLRWAVQMGFQIIPKSVRRHRIEENMQLFDFELSAEEMAKLSGLKGKEDTTSALGYWSPLETSVDLGRTDLGAAESRTDL
uniref:NADP-dependent oxidoreductase domain-containing protein n=1 Tax=Pyrodinium bahamense TaxID=73915 RepID=A0A7S0FMW8_9DINO